MQLVVEEVRTGGGYAARAGKTVGQVFPIALRCSPVALARRAVPCAVRNWDGNCEINSLDRLAGKADENNTTCFQQMDRRSNWAVPKA